MVKSVKNTFSTLLGDVITDVQVSIDCTMFAVEQLITTNNGYYDPRCRWQSNSYDYNNDNTPPQTYDDSSANRNLPDNNVIKTNEKPNVVNKNDKSAVIIIQKQLNDSISNINNSDQVLKQLETIRTSLEGETHRLNEINTFLQTKLDSLSSEIKTKLNKTAIIGNCSLLEDIWKNLQVLNYYHLDESKKDTKVKEIEGAFTEILTILEKRDTDKAKIADETNINDIIHKLADKISIGIKSNIQAITNNTKTKSLKANLRRPKPKVLSVSSPDTKEEHVNELITQPIKSNREINFDSANIEAASVDSKANEDFFKELSFDDDTNSNNAAIVARSEEARNILKDSRQSKAIIDKYFDNPKYELADAFDMDDDKDDVFSF